MLEQAYCSLFQTISAYYCLFRPFTAQFSLFQSIPAQSSLFQPIQVYSSLFRPIQQFQPIPPYASLFQHISKSPISNPKYTISNAQLCISSTIGNFVCQFSNVTIVSWPNSQIYWLLLQTLLFQDWQLLYKLTVCSSCWTVSVL